VRQPGDVVLVSCYEPGHQPQGVASAVAFLRRAGFAPTCLDLAIEPLDAAAEARLAAARLVAISVPMHTAMALGLRVAARVRAANPTAHVCFFGLYAVLNRELLAGGGVADSVLAPDSEEQLVAIASGGAAVLASPGRRDDLVPARDGLPALERYARLAIAGERRVAGHAETTRGCKHMCRHCPIPPVYGGRFFAVPEDAVLDDVRRQVAAGARHIDFGDPDFLNGPNHALRIARALHAEHPGVTFSFTAKVEHIVAHADAVRELAALGALFVVSAVESLSDRVLAALAKGHQAADVGRALAVVRGAGISLRPTFVAFTPWTTLADYVELCGFIRDNRLQDEVDPVQLSIRLLVPPGSLLLAAPDIAPYLGALDPEALTYRWTHPDPRMDQLEADVSALVEAATEAGAAAADTFARIHRLAAGVAGIDIPADKPRLRLSAAPPHLTEPWFCCAQPTRRQLRAV
jgi:radical SAM superfamily enzyme YgiQ (UPF0313 family)